MSWFLNKNKEIYSNAWSAICEDTKNITSVVIDRTSNLIVTGYTKAKDGITYLDKAYHEPNKSSSNNHNNNNQDNNNQNNNNISQNNNNNSLSSNNQNNTNNISQDNMSNNQNNMSNSLSDSFTDQNISFIDQNDQNVDDPDVIIDLSTKAYIKRIYIMVDGIKTRIKGKIASYKCIDRIIHKWFNYEEINGVWRWYPNNDLMTTFRDSTLQLVKMDTIIFRKLDGVYLPYPYQD